MSDRKRDELLKENAELRQRLVGAEETLRAITSGEVDALVVNTKLGERIFTLEGADSVYRIAIENINEGAITLSPEGTILYSNRYFAQMMRTDLNKIIGASILDFVNPESRNMFAAQLSQESGRSEVMLCSGEGIQVPTYIATRKLQLDNLSICAVVTDLTEQKRSEEVVALKDRLAEAQRVSHTGSWEWNLKSGEVRWSDEMYVIFGVDKRTFSPDMPSFTGFIHPDDRKSVADVMSELVTKGGRSSVDFRIGLADGSFRFLHAEGEITASDESGKPTHMIGTNQDITERKKAEQALRQYEQTFVNLVERAPFGIYVIDSHFRISHMNVASQNGAFRNVRPVIGRDIDETMRILWPEQVAAEITAQFRRTLETGEPYSSPSFTNPRHDVEAVESYEWELHRMILPDGQYGVICYYFDSTTLLEAERALKESEERYRSLAENLPAVLMRYNRDFRLVYLSSVSASITGIPVEDCLGKTNREIGHPEHLCRLWESAIDEVLQTGQNKNLEFDFDSTQGKKTFYLSLAPEFDATGGVAYVLGISTDITERKKAEQDLRQRTLELEAANEEMSSFSYTISHDLRAPLRSMDGFSQALLEDYAGHLDEQGRQWLQHIRDSSQTMGQLINDLLGLSRVVRAELKWDRVDLSGMSVSIADDLTKAEPNRRVEFDISSGMEAWADRNLMRLVMENLIGNAFKYTSTRQAARIEVGILERNGERVCFVRDNGVGFDMEYSDKLFKPFQRLHTEKEFPGTGIGLATVRRIIKRLGGEVWAEGEVGKGATFYFSLYRATAGQGRSQG